MSGWNYKRIKYDFAYMTEAIPEHIREATRSSENADMHLRDYTVSRPIRLPLWEHEWIWVQFCISNRPVDLTNFLHKSRTTAEISLTATVRRQQATQAFLLGSLGYRVRYEKTLTSRQFLLASDHSPLSHAFIIVDLEAQWNYEYAPRQNLCARYVAPTQQYFSFA
jgi:hypothetical protein